MQEINQSVKAEKAPCPSIVVESPKRGSTLNGSQPLNIDIPNLPRFCKPTTIGLTIEGDVSIEQWMRAVDVIKKQGKGYQWIHGDALLEGERRFGEDYAQVVDPNEEAQLEKDNDATCRKLMQVASRIPVGKRFPQLKWSHHLKVAFLPDADRDFWLQYAVDNKLGVREMERLIKKANEPDAEPVDPDLLVLQDPAVRAWLEKDIADQRAAFHAVPENAPFLRDQQISRIEASQWQLDRTVEIDCDLVRQAVTELLGTWQQVFNWLKERGRIISPPDVRERLAQLVADGRVKEQKEEGKKEGQKGDMKTVYLPLRNPIDDAKEI